MIRLTETVILRFLLENFDLIELLYKIRRDDDSISGEEFQKVITEKGFNENKIYEYRILKPISNGDLIFNPHYKKFIEFLLKETSLNLPEKWANQTQLINESFTKLQVTTNKQEIKFYIRKLRNTIDEFVTDIQDNLAQLLKDTEAVKAGDNDTDELTKRILKAKDWINFFVKPLNDILDKNQTQSIINSINQLMRYSNDRKYEEDDYEISQLYNHLYFFIDNANKELDVIIKHLVNELIPLLRKIESDSLILSGFIHFLKNPFKPDELPVPLTIPEDVQKYIRCMEEIQLRYEVIDNHLTGKCSTGQPMTDIELICLQFRKVAELIMLSALCAHKTAYQIIHRNIEKEWEASKIRKTLDSIHQDFYPIHFDRVFDVNTKKEGNQRITDGFLLKDECISLIGRCGGILHGFNPYNDKKIFKEVENVKNSFSEWQQKIRRLLITHEIKLFGTDKQLWVYMAYGPKNQVFVEERVPIKSDRLVDF